MGIEQIHVKVPLNVYGLHVFLWMVQVEDQDGTLATRVVGIVQLKEAKAL